MTHVPHTPEPSSKQETPESFERSIDQKGVKRDFDGKKPEKKPVAKKSTKR